MIRVLRQTSNENSKSSKGGAVYLMGLALLLQ